VRTPLTALIGLAESLRTSQPALAPGQADTATALGDQARALSTLVNNLLEMARLQSGAAKLRLEWQSLEEVVGSAIRAAQPALASKPVETSLPADLPLVEFDAGLMERVLVNLLENAARYGASPIVITARVSDSALDIVVRDHGPGLPAALKGQEQTLFEKFRRGEPESATPGVGLGLAICKAVIDAHGGQISAGNALGGGAEFTITLPRRAPPVDPASLTD
jgi:two-component system sensor histidine kinase KdpD